MSVIVSTSGRVHSEFVSLLFLQTHRETDHFFVDSGVQFVPSTSGLFHYRCSTFSSHLKSKIGNILAKVVTLLYSFSQSDLYSFSHRDINTYDLDGTGVCIQT
jgi:hypothetical protein